MPFTPTVFANNGPPSMEDVELNKLGGGIQTAQATAESALAAAQAAIPAPSSPPSGYYLQWDGSAWVATAVTTGALAIGWFNVKDYGALGNGRQNGRGGAMTSGSATLTDTTNTPFASTDVGKTIVVVGAGTGGAPLSTTISAYTSASQVTLAAAAATTVSNTSYSWGTDDTAAIASALAAVPNTSTVKGGTVYFPPGSYLITSGLTSNAPNLRLLGAAGPGGGRPAQGTSHIIVAHEGMWGFTYNPSASSTQVQGITVEYLHFDGPGNTCQQSAYPAANTDVTLPAALGGGAAGGGLRIRRTNNSVLRSVTVSDFKNSTGIQHGGGTNQSMYAEMITVRAIRCFLGLDDDETSGTRLVGGYFDWDNGGDPNNERMIAGGYASDNYPVQKFTTGIRIRRSDSTGQNNSSSFRSFGTILQSYATLVDVQGQASQTNSHEFWGARCEIWQDYAFRFRYNGGHVLFPTMNNFVVASANSAGSFGTGVQVDTGVQNVAFATQVTGSMASVVGGAGVAAITYIAKTTTAGAGAYSS